jgi:hypothetical protein
VSLDDRRRTLRLAVGGVIPYVAAVGLAFVSPDLTLVICAAVAVYYALPAASRRAFVE